jgi:hypothetical protein
MDLVLSLLRHFAHWFSSLSWWEVVKTGTPLVISFATFLFVIRDRRPRLTLKAKKGDWYVLKPLIGREGVVFKGVVEIHNMGSRPNAIREYQFLCRLRGGEWRAMESEQYRVAEAPDEEEEIDESKFETFNETPLTFAPYSGTEVRVHAEIEMPKPRELEVRIAVEDLFGNWYSVKVIAKR